MKEDLAVETQKASRCLQMDDSKFANEDLKVCIYTEAWKRSFKRQEYECRHAV